MNKQREDFEKAFKEELGAHGCQFDLDNEGNYEDRETLCGWLMWQQAQKVAVPDGFVLAPREPTPKMISASFAYRDHGDGYVISEIYKAMIEAQEDST